jgi:hypothetical protein
MEKVYHLDQKEAAMLAQVDQERTNALAMVGALSLDMEQARKNLDSAQERQRSFIRQALTGRGVDRYENARAQNGALIVSMPDETPALPGPPAEASGPKMVERVNGSEIVRE